MTRGVALKDLRICISGSWWGDDMILLNEKLQAAQLEIKVGGSQLGRRNDALRQELATCQRNLADAQRQLEAQMLVAARQSVAKLTSAAA